MTELESLVREQVLPFVESLPSRDWAELLAMSAVLAAHVWLARVGFAAGRLAGRAALRAAVRLREATAPQQSELCREILGTLKGGASYDPETGTLTAGSLSAVWPYRPSEVKDHVVVTVQDREVGRLLDLHDDGAVRHAVRAARARCEAEDAQAARDLLAERLRLDRLPESEEARTDKPDGEADYAETMEFVRKMMAGAVPIVMRYEVACSHTELTPGCRCCEVKQAAREMAGKLNAGGSVAFPSTASDTKHCGWRAGGDGTAGPAATPTPTKPPDGDAPRENKENPCRS